MNDRPLVPAALAVIWHEEKVLIGRRAPHLFLGGMLEFPGGKIEPNESPVQCAVREALEEAGVHVRPRGARPVMAYDYADRRVILHPFDMEFVSGIPKAPFRWRQPKVLRDEDFPPASAPLLADLRAGPAPPLTPSPIES